MKKNDSGGRAPDRVYLSPPDLCGQEQRLVLDAIASNWIAPLGPQVDAFEREFAEYLGVPHAVAVSSGTAALHLAMILLDVGPGDEVLCSTLTFAASANVIRYQGATPVFIDCEASSWNLDPGLLEEELESCARRGRLPKAVIAVDLYGQCCDFDRIEGICRSYEVNLVEDAAEALGATCGSGKAGSFGQMATFSFNGNKIITTSGGGMLVSHSERLVSKARFLATQAKDSAAHYQHSTIGYNYRLSNILAAIGRGQLGVLGQRVDARRRNHAEYVRAFRDLPGIEFMPEADIGRGTRWLTCMTVDPAVFGATREDVRLALEAQNIESRPLWKPMHLQPVFSNFRVRGGSTAEQIFERGLCLPSGSSLSDHDRGRTIQIVRQTRGSQAAPLRSAAPGTPRCGS